MQRARVIVEISALFTGEENYGKMLDLNENYHQYINLKGIDSQALDYLSYLDAVVNMDSVPSSTKHSAAYYRFASWRVFDENSYISTLVEYLQSFLRRSQPLLDFSQLEKEAEELFLVRWSQETNEQESIYCDACIWFTPVLTRGRKYFSKQSVYDAHLTGKKHLKALESTKSSSDGGDVEANKENSFLNKKKEIMKLEVFASKLLEALSEERMETRAALERKQTLTHDEYANRLVYIMQLIYVWF